MRQISILRIRHDDITQTLSHALVFDGIGKNK